MPIIEFATEYPRPTIIEHCVRMGLPFLPADEANEMIVELTIKNLRLQAKLDAISISAKRAWLQPDKFRLEQLRLTIGE